LIAGMLVGYLIAGSQKDEAAARLDQALAEVARLQAGLTKAEERNWAYYRANEALKKQLEQAGGAGSTSTTAVDGGPVLPGSFGDGVFLVGDDMAPGTYAGVVTGTVGYWARLRGTDGSIGAIITNGLPRGPFLLTVEPGDKAVELRGVMLTPR
jgi:hypothetical protein